MKRKLIYLASSLALLITPLIASVSLASAATDIKSGVCAGSDLSVSSSTTCDPQDEENKKRIEGSVDKIIETVINILSVVVGVVAVIMIIVGGLKYITSGGESASVSGAKNTILYALVGLVVVVLAQIVVRFVIQRVTTK